MSYEAIVYFVSPRTRWAGKVQEEDVLLRRFVPWLWLARWIARGVHAQLDATKCGYAVLLDGKELEAGREINELVR